MGFRGEVFGKDEGLLLKLSGFVFWRSQANVILQDSASICTYKTSAVDRFWRTTNDKGFAFCRGFQNGSVNPKAHKPYLD